MDFSELLQLSDWARAQFAMTAMFHWIFVPLTLGLAVLCAIMETLYYRTGDEKWRHISKFWMRLFGINFAVGVATGLILEFEFGTNWSNYSYFVGDIFGAPLAIEGIMAFFMEATFVGVMLFGWGKVSKRFHLASTWLVAISVNLSALWILIANAWMEYPVGTEFNIDMARNEMSSFWDVALSPFALNMFVHSVTSGFVTGAAFVMAVSGWYLLRRRHTEEALRSTRTAAVFGTLSLLVCIYTGDGSAVLVTKHQPMKLAAMEALYDGSEGAPLVVFGVLRPESERTNDDDAFYFKFEIPKLLSVMGTHDFDGYVAGINDLIDGNAEHGILPTGEKIERGREAIAALKLYHDALDRGDKAAAQDIAARFDPNTEVGKEFLAEKFRYFGYGYLASPKEAVPPIALTFYAFRAMVGIGSLFLLIFAAVWYMQRRRERFERMKWLHALMILALPLVYICSWAGWIVCEVGRQPWTVQDLLPTVAAVSKLDTTSVAVTFFIFATLFTVMLAAEIMIMVRQIKIGFKNE